jgi:phosphoadenosine phosphosulfate reductase
MVWSHALKHNVPYNPLHDKNYPSIGCTHCTRTVRPGESARAGRWSGSDKTECGLHVPAPAAAPLVGIKSLLAKSSFGAEES